MITALQEKIVIWLTGIVALLLAGLALGAWAEHRGAMLERAGWQKKEALERIADAALIAKHATDMEAQRLANLRKERETSERHETELATLRRDRDLDRRRADAAGGLRIVAPACPPSGAAAGTEAAGAERRDEPASPATIRLPQPVEDDLWAIANDADEVSAQLRACQGWVRANGFYGSETEQTHHLLDRMIAGKNKEPEAEQ